jgi:hypothetical protein
MNRHRDVELFCQRTNAPVTVPSDADHRDGSRREESLGARSGFAVRRRAPTASVGRSHRRAGVGDSLTTIRDTGLLRSPGA